MKLHLWTPPPFSDIEILHLFARSHPEPHIELKRLLIRQVRHESIDKTDCSLYQFNWLNSRDRYMVAKTMRHSLFSTRWAWSFWSHLRSSCINTITYMCQMAGTSIKTAKCRRTLPGTWAKVWVKHLLFGLMSMKVLDCWEISKIRQKCDSLEISRLFEMCSSRFRLSAAGSRWPRRWLNMVVLSQINTRPLASISACKNIQLSLLTATLPLIEGSLAKWDVANTERWRVGDK